MINEEDIDILERFIKVCDEDLFTEISIKCDGLTRKAIENLLIGVKELKTERDYYKARYNEFYNAFIEGGKKLTKK